MRQLSFSLLGLLAFITFSNFSNKSEKPYKNGDLIFIVNPSGQGKAIQVATKSKFTHIGIVFIENGREIVYHAVEPVSKSTLKEFIALSADGTYEIKRLKNQSQLTNEVVKKMLAEAKSKVGLHYDLAFSWNDDEMYCSEFVWKIYKHTLTINIGLLKPLKSFNLNHPAVREKLEQRYGKNIPLEENMISPGDMFSSPLLE